MVKEKKEKQLIENDFLSLDYFNTNGKGVKT